MRERPEERRETAEAQTQVERLVPASSHSTCTAFADQVQVSPATCSAQPGNRIHAQIGMAGMEVVGGKWSKSSSSGVSPMGSARLAYLAASRAAA